MRMTKVKTFDDMMYWAGFQSRKFLIITGGSAILIISTKITCVFDFWIPPVGMHPATAFIF